jgi:hypothetical protein
MTELRGRALIESRCGPLWSGRQTIVIEGAEYDLDALMFRMGLNFEDARAIDVVEVPVGNFVLRYYDGEDQRVVAHQFDGSFCFVGETRAHIAEWIGEDGYFEFTSMFRFGCPARF